MSVCKDPKTQLQAILKGGGGVGRGGGGRRPLRPGAKSFLLFDQTILNGALLSALLGRDAWPVLLPLPRALFRCVCPSLWVLTPLSPHLRWRPRTRSRR